MEVLHPEDRDRFIQRWKHAMRSGEDFEELLRLRRYDGVFRWHTLRDWPELDAQGEIVRWFGTATDIDDQRRLEDSLREQRTHLELVNRSLEQFAAEASHDLQAPLRQVTSYIDLVARRQGAVLDDQTRGYLAAARAGASKMRDMITGLLDYARAGRVDPHAEQPLPARQAAEEAIDNLGDLIQASDAVVRIQDLPVVRCERRPLVQVYQNLIENALRYRHPQRRPEVEISQQGAEGDRCLLSVRDNGRGIPEDLQDQVFRVFDRGNASNGSGSGIGLAVVKRVIEERGGRIWLESRPDHGTTVTFTLPKAEAESQQQAA
jgi:chemotaxis family two-component system sensor kinase Cph1